jgi:hypothetical protein
METFQGITAYFKTGFLGLMIIWLEWCAFEFLTLMSGYLEIDSTSAQAILFNFECLIYMVAFALSFGSS